MPVKKLPPPDINAVRKRISYNPDTGEVLLRWGKRTYPAPAGRWARVSIDGVSYFVSRLCWYLHTGEWPDEVDHRDGESQKFSNLRDCSHAQNVLNARVRSDNALGVKGVHSYPYGFRARLVIDGKRVRSGTFKTLEEAKTAYASWSKEFHGEFGRV